MARGSSQRANARVANQGVQGGPTRPNKTDVASLGIGQDQPGSQDRSADAAWSSPQSAGMFESNFIDPPSPDQDLAWLLDLEPLPVDFSPSGSHTGAGFDAGSSPAISTPHQPGSVQSNGSNAIVYPSPVATHDSNSALAAFDALMRWGTH